MVEVAAGELLARAGRGIDAEDVRARLAAPADGVAPVVERARLARARPVGAVVVRLDALRVDVGEAVDRGAVGRPRVVADAAGEVGERGGLAAVGGQQPQPRGRSGLGAATAERVNASREPSGDQRGAPSRGPAVSRLDAPPANGASSTRESVSSVSASTVVATYATAPSVGRTEGAPTAGSPTTKSLAKGRRSSVIARLLARPAATAAR